MAPAAIESLISRAHHVAEHKNILTSSPAASEIALRVYHRGATKVDRSARAKMDQSTDFVDDHLGMLPEFSNKFGRVRGHAAQLRMWSGHVRVHQAM